MNKKKLCATLTLSAFAASLLPGLAFADAQVTPDSVTQLTPKITISDSSATWLSAEDKVTIVLGVADVTDEFKVSFDAENSAVVLEPLKLEAKDYDVTIVDSEDAKQTIEKTITVSPVTTLAFELDANDKTQISITDTTNLAENDGLYMFDEGTRTIGAPITTADGQAIVANSNKKIVVDADLLVVGTYAIASKDAPTTIKALIKYTDKVKAEVDAAAGEVTAAAQAVADAIPATVTFAVGTDGATADAVDTTVEKLEAVAAAMTEANLQAGAIVVKDKGVTGEIARYYDATTKKITCPTDKDKVAGEITFVVNGLVEKTVAVEVVKAQAAQDVIDAYIADNFADYADGVANVTMQKGDKFVMTLADTLGTSSVDTGNKVVLVSNKVAVDSQYIDLTTGEIVNVPAEGYTTELTMKFVKSDGTDLVSDTVTINLTLGADTPITELPPVGDLGNYSKEELAEIKVLADKAKADAKVELNAAADEYAASLGEDFTTVEFFQVYAEYKKSDAFKNFVAAMDYVDAVDALLK